MKIIENILTPEEIVIYQEGWRNFRDKYKLNSSYHAHSGKPVISEVYRFEDKPIFRAHVFNRRLRSFDPYFLAKKHIPPFWNLTHYVVVSQQLYNAATIGIRNSDKLHVMEVPLEFKLSKPIFWRYNTSVEFIWQPRRQIKGYSIEDCFFSFYYEKDGKINGRVSARTFVGLRSYVQEMEKLKQDNKEALETLIRKISEQAINHENLINPRQNILATKEYLINELKKGNLPEKEIHDFFSFWDKPE